MLIVGAFAFLLTLLEAQEGVGLVESAPVSFDWSALASLKTLQPEFVRGRLFVQHMDGPLNTTYSVYAQDGQLISRFKIDLPGVQQTIGGRITPLVNTDGYVAIAIAVQGSERVATLCFLDKSGKLLKVVKTSPFWPFLLTVADDGTIWAFGAAGSDENPNSDAPLVYQFSNAGDVLGSSVPRKLFGQDPPFELSADLGVAVIRSAGKRVVLYSPHTYQLLGLALDRSIIDSYTIKPPEVERRGRKTAGMMKMMGLTVTNEGTVYARLTGGDGTGLYRLDRAAKRWIPLPSDVMEKVRSYSLIGSTADELALIPATPHRQFVNLKRIRLTTLTP
jgi:hypothetical protein